MSERRCGADMSEHRLAEGNSPVRIVSVLATVLGLLVVFALAVRGPIQTEVGGKALGVAAVTAEHATGSGGGRTTAPSATGKLAPIPQRSAELAGNPLLRAQQLPRTTCELPRLGRT